MTELVADVLRGEIGHEGRDAVPPLLAERHDERQQRSVPADVSRRGEESEPVQLDVRRGFPRSFAARLEEVYGIREAGVFRVGQGSLHRRDGEGDHLGDFT